MQKTSDEVLVQLAKSGNYTLTDIGNEVGLSRERVRQRLKASGVVLEKNYSSQILSYRRYPEEVRKEAITLASEIGVVQAAEKFGTSATTLRSWGAVGPASEMDNYELKRLYEEENYSTTMLARKYNTSQQTIYQRLRTVGTKMRKRGSHGGGRPTHRGLRPEILELHAQGLSINQIARKVEAAPGTVRYHVERNSK